MTKRVLTCIVLSIIIGISLGVTVSAFSDVPLDAWYYDSVSWAVDNGITNGTSETTFSPDNTCTTAQIITFLWRANGTPEPSISNPFWNLESGVYYEKAAIWACENGLIEGEYFFGDFPCTRSATVTYLWKLSGSPWSDTEISFDDVDSQDDYAQAVEWAVNNGITNGTSVSEFSPYATCTRGQIVTFLYRWCGVDNSGYEQLDKSIPAETEATVTGYSAPVREQSSSKVTVPTEEETTGNLVWVPTRGGTKYHNHSGCSNMIDPIQVSVETAISNGYSACKRCYK